MIKNFIYLLPFNKNIKAGDTVKIGDKILTTDGDAVEVRHLDFQLGKVICYFLNAPHHVMEVALKKLDIRAVHVDDKDFELEIIFDDGTTKNHFKTIRAKRNGHAWGAATRWRKSLMSGDWRLYKGWNMKISEKTS